MFHLPSNVGSHTGSDIVCDDVGVVVRLVVSEAFQHLPLLTCSICLLMLALTQALTLSVMIWVLLLGLLSVRFFQHPPHLTCLHLPSNVGSHTGSDIVCDDVGVVVRLVVSEVFQHLPHLTCSICLLMLALIQALTLSVMMWVLLLGLLSVRFFSTRHISLVPFAF